MNENIFLLENEIYLMESIHDFDMDVNILNLSLMNESVISETFEKFKRFIKDLFDKLRHKIMEYKVASKLKKIEKEISKINNNFDIKFNDKKYYEFDYKRFKNQIDSELSKFKKFHKDIKSNNVKKSNINLNKININDFLIEKKCNALALKKVDEYNKIIDKYIDYYENEFNKIGEEIYIEYTRLDKAGMKDECNVILNETNKLKRMSTDVSKTLLRIFIKCCSYTVLIFDAIDFSLNFGKGKMSTNYITGYTDKLHQAEVIARNTLTAGAIAGVGVAGLKAADKIK